MTNKQWKRAVNGEEWEKYGKNGNVGKDIKGGNKVLIGGGTSKEPSRGHSFTEAGVCRQTFIGH